MAPEVVDFSFRERPGFWRRLEDEEFDLLIIGGGVNGAGVARDAASRGMKVAVLERSDFASGTSSRSSKLVHGGIRYLENLEFGLVFEALSERQLLFEMAPHLTHPLRFLLPLYEGGRVGMGKMGLGMWLYDALSLFQAPKLHERLSRDQSLSRVPSLRSKELLGAYEYSDAYMDDDRLVHETLRAAVRLGAVALNYCAALRIETKNSKGFFCVTAKDEQSGLSTQIRARHVVSTVGPWTDELREQMLGQKDKVLRPTKGVHLTFSRERFPISRAVVMAAEERIVFAIPRHEMVIVGTTDTDFPLSPAGVRAEKADVDYLLAVLRQYFPGAQLGSEDVIATYAGVRPLVRDSSASEGKTSREHEIWTDESGVTFVAGGKYTTYRRIAEQAVQECLRHFSIDDQNRFLLADNRRPLNPWIDEEGYGSRFRLVDELSGRLSWSRANVQMWVDRHGDEALNVVRRLGVNWSYWEMEAIHAIQSTMCLNLLDFVTRRTPLFLSAADHGESQLEAVARVFAESLGWDASMCQEQVAAVRKHCEYELHWRKLT